MLLLIGGVDIILFTGGVGENQSNCRSEVCEGLEFMGVKNWTLKETRFVVKKLLFLPMNPK